MQTKKNVDVFPLPLPCGRWRVAGPGRAILLALALCLAGTAAPARRVRVATWNVEHGIGEEGSAKRAAQEAVLRRLDADIVAFQELNGRTSNAWVKLAGELGYAHRAWGERGPFAGGMTVGYYSRFPIREAVTVRSPPGAREFSRYPLRLTVEAPGAARPLTLWNMHHKAVFRPQDDFRRAVEARRIMDDIEAFLSEHPERIEWIVLGDMNDDAARGRDPDQRPQTPVFHALPEGLPKTYIPGGDIAFPLPYRSFPLDRYRKAGGGLYAVEAFRENSRIDVTHLYTHFRLDYILVSAAIRNHSAGAPAAEIYHSQWDRGDGRPKHGSPLPAETVLAASDHYPVFVDIRLERAAEAF